MTPYEIMALLPEGMTGEICSDGCVYACYDFHVGCDEEQCDVASDASFYVSEILEGFGLEMIDRYVDNDSVSGKIMPLDNRIPGKTSLLNLLEDQIHPVIMHGGNGLKQYCRELILDAIISRAYKVIVLDHNKSRMSDRCIYGPENFVKVGAKFSIEAKISVAVHDFVDQTIELPAWHSIKVSPQFVINKGVFSTRICCHLWNEA